MDELMKDNMLKILYNNLIRETMVLWSKSKNKSFLVCFKEVMKNRGFKWEQSGLNIRYILRKLINYLNSTTIAQIICYAYEIILLDKNIVEAMKQNAKFKEKKGIHASEDIENDYQFINCIRNAISHNNDLDKSSYTYSDLDENYTFILNKEGKECSKIIINKKDLTDFLDECVTSSELYKMYSTNLALYLDNIHSSSPVSKNIPYMKLKSKESKNFIEPDENQSKVIEELVEYIRENHLINPYFIKLYYPYKQNAINNYLGALDFFCLMEEIYFSRTSTFLEYINNVGELGLLNQRQLKVIEDLTNMFMTNRIFQIFTTTNNQFIKESLEGVLPFDKYNKLRNAIIHGTYYRDFNGNLYFYDAPRGKKTEEYLKFVDVFSKDDFIVMSNAFFAKKYDKENYKK